MQDTLHNLHLHPNWMLHKIKQILYFSLFSALALTATKLDQNELNVFAR